MAHFKIGIIRETRRGDKRVTLTPDSIARLKKQHTGMFDFLVESGAGKASGFSDEAYVNAGATLVPRMDIIKQSDMLLWFKRPGNDIEEIQSIPTHGCVAGFLDPLKPGKHIEALAARKINAFTLEFLPHTDDTAHMDAFAAMGRLAGLVSLDDAVKELSVRNATAKPRVLVVGTGNVGLEAAEKAIHRGYDVAVLASSDQMRSAILSRPRKDGQEVVFTSHAADAGSVKPFAELAKTFQPNIVICAARKQGKKAPLIINKDGFNALPDGCIVEDLAASIGGNTSALTDTDKDITLSRNILVRNLSNYPSARPDQASTAYSLCMEHQLSHIAQNIKPEQKLGDFLANDTLLSPALILHNGQKRTSPGPVVNQAYKLSDLARFNLKGRHGKTCDTTSIMQQSPDVIEKLNSVLKNEYGIANGRVRYIGHGGSALIVAVDDDQVIRISPHIEPKRIHSEHILRNHTPMVVVKPDNHYLNLEVAAFPYVMTLGDAIKKGRITQAEAAVKFSSKNQQILAQGYHLADGADMNSAIPKDNIGVFDDGTLTVLDGGMYSAEPQNLDHYHDGARDFSLAQYAKTASRPSAENGHARISDSQLEHMKSRDLVMGEFKRSQQKRRALDPAHFLAKETQAAVHR